MRFAARKNDNGKIQDLCDHLNNVGNMSILFSMCPNISKLAGLLHDIGKSTDKFQNYLNHGGIKGTVVHAYQGAMLVEEIECDNSLSAILLKEILELTIVGHHNRLKDCVSPDGTEVIFDKIKNQEDEKYDYEETISNLEKIQKNFMLEIKSLYGAAQKEINNVLGKINSVYKQKSSCYFAIGLFVKYIYSCLIDADRYDAYMFDIEDAGNITEKISNSQEKLYSLAERLENNIEMLDKKDEISKIRMEISNQCKNAALNKDTGIYILSVPTGGGKTISSLRFALNHAKKLKKSRIIYVIPYLSIIEQTAQSIRNNLGLNGEDFDLLLEHHSNIFMPEDENASDLYKLFSSRWDKPIIITTMVQFLETVMSSKSGELRKLHNMQNSVIIFDEIQSLPIRTINLFNEVVSFLSKILNTTILLCSATQPLLDKTERKNLLLSCQPELADIQNTDAKIFKRVNIVVENEMTISDFSDFILKKIQINKNCLVIVNTKKTAKNVYSLLEDYCRRNEIELLHLSTSLCSANRKDVLKKVFLLLEEKKKFILISTQLIEAGVDISFECVIRAMAGLDSILQAAGRCNRNGEFSLRKYVYVVPVFGENLDMLLDIKEGKEIFRRIANENRYKDFTDKEVLDKYYEYYFFRRKNEMDYTVNNYCLYNLLSDKNCGKSNYKNRTGQNYNHILSQAFASADDDFAVIENYGEKVVVYYGESEDLINRYKQTPNPKEKLRIIKKLEKYSVTIFRQDFEKLLTAISITEDEFGIKILDKNYYSEKLGVLDEIDVNTLIT